MPSIIADQVLAVGLLLTREVEGRSSQEKVTPGFVGVFAYGPGEKIVGGSYDNHLIGRKLFHLLDESYKFSSNR